MYKIVKESTGFSIIETETDLKIRSFSSHDAAHTLYRKLKGGSGFNGNTPPFFVVELPK